jgi:putative transcriptional regulator
MSERENIMSKNAEHFVRGKAEKCEAPYEYKECGLTEIFLHNGFERHVVGDEEFVSVLDTEGLHCAIGVHIVRTRTELEAAHVRFLRKEMGMTQSELGRVMAQSSQQIARWEKTQSGIPGPADRLLRLLFLRHTGSLDDSEDFRTMLEEIEGMDDLTPRRIQFYLNDDNAWQRGGVRRLKAANSR